VRVSQLGLARRQINGTSGHDTLDNPKTDLTELMADDKY
jgi:hypothetical protein